MSSVHGSKFRIYCVNETLWPPSVYRPQKVIRFASPAAPHPAPIVTVLGVGRFGGGGGVPKKRVRVFPQSDITILSGFCSQAGKKNAWRLSETDTWLVCVYTKVDERSGDFEISKVRFEEK